MKSILTLIAVAVCIAAHAQDTSKRQNITINDNDTLKEFTVVQVQAQFPGGPTAWVKYLQANLRADVGAENIRLRRKQQDSTQTVVVSFLVDKEGNVSEVKVENPAYVHPKVGAEAVRVIQNGPKWSPAIQNGQRVLYRQKQLISFQVSRG